MKTIDVLGKFIVTEIAAERDEKSLEPDEDLLRSGVIDSMALMDLVLFLEKTFGIEVEEEDLVPENFQSLNSIVEYAEQKVANK